MNHDATNKCILLNTCFVKYISVSMNIIKYSLTFEMYYIVLRHGLTRNNLIEVVKEDMIYSFNSLAAYFIYKTNLKLFS